MNEMAQAIGYCVMVAGGALAVLFAFMLVWAAACGVATGVIRSIRAIKAARRGVKS